MLLIKTYVAPSTFQGLGVFVTEPVKKGDIIWRFQPGFDQVVDPQILKKLPAVTQEMVFNFADVAPESLGGGLLFDVDNSRYMNHSRESPNVQNLGEEFIALRDIAAGEELSYDYGFGDIPFWTDEEKASFLS